LFVQETYSICEKGEKRGRGREIIKFARQSNKIIGDAQGH